MNLYTQKAYNERRNKKTGLLFIASLLLFLITLVACEKHSKDEILLKQALALLEKDPEQAFCILDSIKHPEKMDEQQYMQYQLILIQAKSKTNRDVTGDTAIVDILSYFQKKGDLTNSLYASFYAGVIYDDSKIMDKALEYYLSASDKALQIKNFSVAGKALNNIGWIYYRQGFMDSAIVHLKRSLNFLDESQISKALKISPLHTISASYLNKSDLKEAKKYIEQGLKLSVEVADNRSEAIFLNLKGLALYKGGNYSDAKKYYTESLVKTNNTQDSARYLLNFALLYNKTFQLDSAKYYIDIINKNINSNPYKPTQKTFYNLLSQYYREMNNTTEALRYKDLANKVSEEIIHSRNVDKLIKANEKHINALREEQTAKEQAWQCLIFILLIAVSLLIYLYKRFRNRQLTLKNKLLIEGNKLLESQNQLLQKDSDAINFLVDMLKTIIEKDSALNKKLKVLQETYRTTEKPQIFLETEEMVTNIEDLINKQLLVISKKYLDKQVPALLNDREVLYVTLRAIGLNEDEIYATPNFSGIENEKFKMIKYRIRKKFKDGGISDKSINLLLLSENSILLKDNQVALLKLQERIDEEKQSDNSPTK